ncbi:hypothetical protein KJ633_00970 [bacterium]|nr:hypothetical protein [bacterium]
MLKNAFATVIFFTALCLYAADVIVEVRIPSGTTTEAIAEKYLKNASDIKEVRRLNKLLPKGGKELVESPFVNIPKNLLKEKVCDASAARPLVLTRKEKEIKWEKLPSGRRLFPGDGVMTSSDGSVRLGFLAGGSLFLGPDSLIFLKENEERPSASFLAGNISVDDIRVVSRGVKVQPARFAKYNINTSPDKNVRLSVHSGEIDVTAHKKTVKVKEGFGTLVAFGSVPEAPRPLPAGISDFNNLPGLKEGEKYHFQIASDDKFQNMISDKYLVSAAGVEAEKENLPPGGYYLRASLLSKDGFESRWSAFYYFVKGPESRDIIKVESITDLGDGVLEVKGSCKGMMSVVINGHPGKALEGDRFICEFLIGEAEIFTVFIQAQSDFFSKRYKKTPSNLWLPID